MEHVVSKGNHVLQYSDFCPAPPMLFSFLHTDKGIQENARIAEGTAESNFETAKDKCVTWEQLLIVLW